MIISLQWYSQLKAKGCDWTLIGHIKRQVKASPSHNHTNMGIDTKIVDKQKGLMNELVAFNM